MQPAMIHYDDMFECRPVIPRHTTALPKKGQSVVYFVAVGWTAIKIGFSTDLKHRLRTFRGASAEDIEVLFYAPGGRRLESRLHLLFAEARINNEFFHATRQLKKFIELASRESIEVALMQMFPHRWSPSAEARRAAFDAATRAARRR
jgi:hypothetical protein